MQLSNAPGKIVLPFANSGDKNAIPVATSPTPGAASYTVGFPPETSIPIEDGGTPPDRPDFNGILNAISAVSRWYNAGGSFSYDAALSTAIGGYPKGARVLAASGLTFWVSTVDNNTSNPDTGGANWSPDFGSSRPVASVYLTSPQVVGSGQQKVNFDGVEFDSYGLWDSTNKRFNISVAGKYRINSTVLLDNPPSQAVGIQLAKNGTRVKQGMQAVQITDQDLGVCIDAIVDCASGDFLEITMFLDAGATLAQSAQYSFYQIEYIGK